MALAISRLAVTGKEAASVVLSAGAAKAGAGISGESFMNDQRVWCW
jgi:hypothetical protein